MMKTRIVLVGLGLFVGTISGVLAAASGARNVETTVNPATHTAKEHIGRLLFVRGRHDAPSLAQSAQLTKTPSDSEGQILLNEICFQPATGQPQFVELKNASGTIATFEGHTLKNETGQEWRFPSNLTLPPNRVLLVLFDGQDRVEGLIIHADRARFLSGEASGSVQLVRQESEEDRVAWGDQPDASRLGRGGVISGFPAGGTLARLARSTAAADPRDWLPVDPAGATPGTANSEPRVTILLPLDGAMLRKGEASLSWYVVPGATRYRVQIARADDAEFRNPILDRMVSAPPISTNELSTGSFLWRVEAVAGDGTPSGFSRANRIDIEPPPSPPTSSSPAGAAPPAPRRVPLIKQRKDTRMIRLENLAEEGAHAWNVAHPDLDPDDESDAGNCAPASIAMINAFYGGRLSQDRINFFTFGKDGPENDLRPDMGGFTEQQTTRGLEFALGRQPTLEYRAGLYAGMLSVDNALIHTRLEKGIPMLASNGGHAIVYSGITPDGKVIVNDPWSGIYSTRELDFLKVWSMAKPGLAELLPGAITPRSDEESIRTDSDHDGIVDFDEVNRFKTDPHKTDFDGDEVSDFKDLRASVFQPPWGYRFRMEGSSESPSWIRGGVALVGRMGRRIGLRGRDFDGDGTPMERDEDSDAGGCFDGLEDSNANGRHEPALKELYNFDKDDDACLSGSLDHIQDTSYRTDSYTTKLDVRHSVQFSFREVDGAWKGRATVTDSFRFQGIDPVSPGCPGNHIETSEPYQYVVDVQAQVVKSPDGTVSVGVTSPGWQPPMLRIASTCPEVPPVEKEVVAVGIGGVLRNGVFDGRVDIPLSDGMAGTWYYEVHIRQSGRR